MLPLETTPMGEETHNLTQTVQIDMQELFQSSERHHGQYPTDATAAANALVAHICQDDLKEICHRVTVLLSKLGMDMHNGCHVEFNVPDPGKAITTG